MFFFSRKRNFSKKSGKKKLSLGKVIWIMILFLVILMLWLINKKIFEEIILNSEMMINNKINLAIDKAVEKCIKRDNLVTSDFYKINFGDSGIEFFSANNILINNLCCKLAIELPNEFLDNKDGNKIDFYLGKILLAMLGINFLSLNGPKIKINILPVGSALIDYETKFFSVGINQTNFQVWLKIRFNGQIISPLNKKRFVVKKKIFLVNTVINGKIPEVYMKSVK